MDAEILIDHIRQNWMAVIFIVCMTSYFVYSTFSTYMKLLEARKKRKGIEAESVSLDERYNKQVEEMKKSLFDKRMQTKERK